MRKFVAAAALGSMILGSAPALAQSAPPGAGLPSGLYVSVIDGAINLSNKGGSHTFSAGQFGYTANVTKPPVVVPANPGLTFTPPPTFSSQTDLALAKAKEAELLKLELAKAEAAKAKATQEEASKLKLAEALQKLNAEKARIAAESAKIKLAQAQNAAILACTGANVSATACKAAVQAFVAIAPKSAAGDTLRTGLITAIAASSTPATRAMLAEVITVVAQSSNSTAFQEAALKVAETVTTGTSSGTSFAAQGSLN